MPAMNKAVCGLSAYNFMIAAMQTGFGPFVNLALIGAGWNQTDTGLALSIGTIGALASNSPAAPWWTSWHRNEPSSPPAPS